MAQTTVSSKARYPAFPSLGRHLSSGHTGGARQFPFDLIHSAYTLFSVLSSRFSIIELVQHKFPLYQNYKKPVRVLDAAVFYCLKSM